MSNFGKCKDNFKFSAHYGPAKKNKERVMAICTSFSVLAFQSVEFSFAGKTKIQMLTTSCWSLTLPIHGLLKSLRLYVKIKVLKEFIISNILGQMRFDAMLTSI